MKGPTSPVIKDVVLVGANQPRTFELRKISADPKMLPGSSPLLLLALVLVYGLTVPADSGALTSLS
jgi:hypothetical protein